LRTRVTRTTLLPLLQNAQTLKPKQTKAAELAEAIALYEAQLAELRPAAAGGGGDGEAALVCVVIAAGWKQRRSLESVTGVRGR
jgi:hypothetical protein